MSTIRLDWESPDPVLWGERLAACGRSTAFQSWGWGAASAAVGEAAVRRAYIEKNGRPVGLLQVFEERRLGLFTLGKAIRGPLFFRSVLPEDRVAALKQAAKNYPLNRLRRFSALPELPDGPAAHGLMAEAGFHRALAGYETAWIDLSRSEADRRAALRRNFRNQLVRAEAAGFEIREPSDPRPLLARYEAHRKAVGYTGPSAAMLGALPQGDTLCLEAVRDAEIVAGVLFVLHGQAATYQVGWTAAAGRKGHAHNLLLWRGLQALCDRGIRYLDLGGLDWAKAPSVAHFKAGLGGEAFSLPGTFV